MTPYEIWFVLFAVFGVAVVAPAWVYFVNAYLASPAYIEFMATAFLPLTALLMAVSWLQPGSG